MVLVLSFYIIMLIIRRIVGHLPDRQKRTVIPPFSILPPISWVTCCLSHSHRPPCGGQVSPITRLYKLAGVDATRLTAAGYDARIISCLRSGQLLCPVHPHFHISVHLCQTFLEQVMEQNLLGQSTSCFVHGEIISCR